MSNQDTLFSIPVTNLGNWTFDERVAAVFPDMILRSIPGYSYIISMIGILAKRFVRPGTQVYDLGCSLGAVTLSVRRNIFHKGCKIIAVDNSPAMIERCRLYVDACKNNTPVEVIESDIRDININNASLIVLNFTLQFLTSKDCLLLLNKIYRGLKPGGALVLSEKFSFENKKVNEILYQVHHEFKRTNGYSDLLINQKRSMLEHAMLTNSVKMHKLRLSQAGFKHKELWFQCINFGSILALKEDNT